MQRSTFLVLILIVVAAFGYWKRDLIIANYYRVRGITPPPTRTGPGALPPPQPGAPAYQPPPFVSVLPTPAPSGEKQFAPPGTFYLVDRVVVTSRNGVQAARPGEHVKLLERMANGRLRVTIDNADFVVDKKQVTEDVEEARLAEERYRTGAR